MSNVEAYAMAWHPQQGGRIRIKETGKIWGSWTPVTHDALAAFSVLMREEPLQLTDNGWIRTGPEEAGD